jgi:hypothetical protein
MGPRPTSTTTATAFAGKNEEDDRDREKDTNDSPVTPLDEPRPPRVEDPPSEPDEKGPYVVRGSAPTTTDGKTEAER